MWYLVRFHMCRVFLLVSANFQTDNNTSKFEEYLSIFEAVLWIGKTIGFRIRHICFRFLTATYSKVHNLECFSWYLLVSNMWKDNYIIGIAWDLNKLKIFLNKWLLFPPSTHFNIKVYYWLSNLTFKELD